MLQATKGFVSKLALSGIGTLAFAAITLQPTLAAPTLTLKASFDGANGKNPFAALTPAGNGLFYGTAFNGGDNNFGSIFEFDPAGTAPVPGPLPLMGVTAAYGWSRKLRRRIEEVRPEFPIGR